MPIRRRFSSPLLIAVFSITFEGQKTLSPMRSFPFAVLPRTVEPTRIKNPTLFLLAALFVIYLVLPLLHRLRLTTAYTYLEMRFNLPVRLLGSVLFMLLRGGWLATVIYGPSLALSAVIPLPKVRILV